MPNFMRLALGTLTRIPVPAPDGVNRHVAMRAMAIAPVIGLLLALLVGIPMLALSAVANAGAQPIAALLIAALAVGGLTWLTRALHLDGLADTADALGSARPAEQALEIARRSDIGPFGVIAIVLDLLLQVLALGLAIVQGHGFLALGIAVIGGRIAITIACRRGVPAARPDGLGALVASTVPTAIVILWAIALVVIAGGLAIVEGAAPGGPMIAAALGLLAAVTVVRIARRRLNGITGDVIGASVEMTTTVILVVVALTA